MLELLARRVDHGEAVGQIVNGIRIAEGGKEGEGGLWGGGRGVTTQEGRMKDMICTGELLIENYSNQRGEWMFP